MECPFFAAYFGDPFCIMPGPFIIVSCCFIISSIFMSVPPYGCVINLPGFFSNFSLHDAEQK